MIAIRRVAQQIGASYIWGLINFTAGIILGNVQGSFLTQIALKIHHH